MRDKSRRIALCGMMCALAVVIMMMGGMIPLATFCCPALAGLFLVPVYVETNKRLSLGAYAAIAALSLILGPDKESALLFAFLGYYPVLKWTLDRIAHRPLRLLAKLAVFNGAAGAMMLCVAFVFNMQSVIQEYAGMTRVMLAVFVVMSNFTMLVYDRLLSIARVIYLKKFRPKLMKG